MAGKIINLIGMKFGKLKVIKRAKNNNRGGTRWICRCGCGNIKTIESKSLLHGSTKSCGCWAKELARKARMIDLTGKRFGELTVIALNQKMSDERKKLYWLCKCDCGNEKIVLGTHLKGGFIKSCGCLVNIHNLSKSKAHYIWQGMIGRCYNSNNKVYKYYGGRGVKVCNRWMGVNGQGFVNFLKDMGHPPKNKSLDRIDNNENYEPNNCRWADTMMQMRNKRNNRLITINNKTKCLAEWCEIYKLEDRYNIVRQRIVRDGWTPEEALELTPRKKKAK